jgi:hypothetical protein
MILSSKGSPQTNAAAFHFFSQLSFQACHDLRCEPWLRQQFGLRVGDYLAAVKGAIGAILTVGLRIGSLRCRRGGFDVAEPRCGFQEVDALGDEIPRDSLFGGDTFDNGSDVRLQLFMPLGFKADGFPELGHLPKVGRELAEPAGMKLIEAQSGPGHGRGTNSQTQD